MVLEMANRNCPKSDAESEGNAAERGSSAGISRRKALQVGGFVGVGSLLGIPGATNDVAASADGSEPKEEIYLNYDGYDSWDEIYRMSNGSGDNLSLVSSPTYSGDSSLQLAVQEDEHWGISTHYEFDDGLLELNTRVTFALNSNWDMSGRSVANCRLWNCAMALDPDGNSGGGEPDGTNGWSNRMYVSSKGTTSDGPYNLLSYTYHMDKSQDHDYIIDGNDYVVKEVDIHPGRWYEFEYYVRVNTVSNGEANNDGVVKYWLDDDLIYDRQDLRFTVDLDENIIDSNGPVGHYGGGYTAPQNLYAYYDEHAMALDGTFS
ncbi:hypothetical protein [Natrinema salifodinae]|uniref:Polysaccharide lyase n=1 Tax=Natrinema salifodinae TaxID=1202768 RepID=A0A1I0QRJ7_9EURY|nr:hypothetical protein [Natrinema salifodinae]SEW30148.1 hypothetical protein SAMN05216285_3808 [Natrinema salifodinae]